MIFYMINIIKNNLPILIIILILFSYLGVKAFNPDGWDGWTFPTAQVLMSNQYWVRDGLIKHYFLFIAYPYSKLIYYLDEPEFRNRMIDDFGGALKRNRIYYTHYPPGYLIPFALIEKIGITQRSLLRIFALLISLSGLAIFYWFIKSFSNKIVAAIASVYYGFSVIFLNFADSIQTPPWSALFMFLIMALNVLAWRNFANQKKYSYYNSIIWFTYLVLSLLSYDATFFVFAYLILFDVLIQKKFLWRRWLLFASAPVLGFSLQILQNIWYLGWHDMWQDFYNAYKARQIGTLKNFILGIITPFVSMTGVKTIYFFKKTVVVLGSAMLIIGILWKLRSKINLNFNFFRIVFVLAGAAIAQPFFINITGWWPYQGVLTAPFWGLLIGTSSLLIVETFKQKFFLGRKEKNAIIILSVIVLGFWAYQFFNTWTYIKDWPNNMPPKQVVEFGKTIQTFFPDKEKMAFRILPKNPIWKSQFPTFSFEYYLGMPKVDFANTHDLLVDFWWFRNISEYPFYSFIISENKSDVEKIRQKLITENIKGVSQITEIQDQYLFTVDPK